jgi:putative AbiEi antitoxin of type IV toxin-antitoxin system/uncharacterized protein DUF559
MESAAARVARLAGKQWGVVSRAQLHEAGVGDSTVTAWVRNGRLHRMHRGVYALGHTAVGVMGRVKAALLWAGPGALLSHTTAAWWWGIVTAEPTVIHLSVPGRTKSSRGLRVHRPRELEGTVHKGMPVTTVSRTIRDISSMLQFRDLRKALAEADFKRLLDIKELRATRGQPGGATLTRAVKRHQPRLARAKSDLEIDFIELCEHHAIPMPEINVWRAGFLVDAVWEKQQLVVEADGGAAHGTPARAEEDRNRELRLRAAGYRTIRYTYAQVTEAPEVVAADLRAQLS